MMMMFKLEHIFQAGDKHGCIGKFFTGRTCSIKTDATQTRLILWFSGKAVKKVVVVRTVVLCSVMDKRNREVSLHFGVAGGGCM